MTHYVGWLPVLAGFFPVYSMTFFFLIFHQYGGGVLFQFVAIRILVLIAFAFYP